MRQNAKNMSTEPRNGASDVVGSENVYCATLLEEAETRPPEYPLPGKTPGTREWGPGDPHQNFQEKAKNQISPIPMTPQTPYTSPPALQGDVLPQDTQLDGYHPAYGQKLIDFFDSHEKYAIITETLVWKSGEVREVQKKIANPPPSFRDFAKSLGVRYKTLELWAKKYPDFLECFEEATEIYKDFLIENGLLGKYTGEFTKFVAKNKVGMKDQSETKNLNVNFSVNTLLDEIEKK